MDFDSADLLSLAIESVENEAAESINGKNINIHNKSKNIENANVSLGCPNNDDFFDDQEDVLALALDSIEGIKNIPCKKKKSLTGVDLDFKSNTEEKTSRKSENGIVLLGCSKHDAFFDDQEDILALALDNIEGNENITSMKKKSSRIGVDLDFENNSETESISEKKKSPNVRTTEKSLVHTGDTDSSDDEDNKYFEESRYDSYGKSIKRALKDTEKRPSLFGVKGEPSWKGKAPNNSSAFVAPEKSVSPKVKNEANFDPVFGIRIVNPLISSQSIKEKMHGRTPISFMKLKSHVTHGDLKSDWVVAAVIVRKFPPKVSQNGSNYSNWLLSDLKGNLKTASLFLFGRAHEELWKTPSGTVLAILNPSVFNDKKPSDFEAKLSIKSSDQVMIWGRSKDLGQCNFRKKNGEICGTFVNVSECEFCVYHVQQEYKKFNSRSELQYDGKSKINLRNKVLGKNEVFYGGKSFTALPFVGKKAHNPKDKDRLKGLGVSRRDLKVPEEIVSIPDLQRSNKVFNLLPSGNTLLPSKVLDQKRLNALANGDRKDVLKSETKHSDKKFNSPGTGIVEKKPSLTNPGSEISFEFESNSKENTSVSLRNNKKENSNNKTPVREKKSPSTNHGNEISFDIQTSHSNKKSISSSKNKVKDDPKRKTPVQEKKPLLSNPENEISFELEVNPSKTPVSSSKKVTKRDSISKTQNATKLSLQKRFSSLANMSSSANENIANDRNKKLQVPIVCNKDQNLKSPFLKSVQNQSPKIQNNKKPTPTVKSNEENLVQNMPHVDKGLATEQHEMPTEQLISPNQTSLETLDMLSPSTRNTVSPMQRPLPKPKPPPNSGMSKAKLKALQFIKSKGPISKENPSGTEPLKKGIKRPLSPTSEEDGENKKPVLSERFLELMNQKSIHEDLVEVREKEQELEYFEKMEKKDRLEEKMLNTFKVDCKAVKCLKCNYTWFSASDACKAEGHPIKVIDAVKRFFKCGKCQNRTVSLTFMPLIPCKKCFSTNWIRAPMIREKIAKNDTLSIRGGEQKFVNSVITNASLDLLVPD